MKYTGRSLAIAGAMLLGTASTSATAQTTATEAGSGYVTHEEDDGFPWGLLGLLGLAGLLGRKREDRRSVRAESANRAG